MTLLDILIVFLMGIFIGASVALGFASKIISKITEDMRSLFLK